MLSAQECLRTGRAIAGMQQSSGGAIPWFPGGHTDPWDHIESAMALTVTGLREEAEAAFEWSRRTQRADGSWPMQFRGDTIENTDSDSNFAAYIAVGVWHHHLVTGDHAFVGHMWPTVRAALDHVLSMQGPGGEIYWARGESGVADEALLTGCSSIHHACGARCGSRRSWANRSRSGSSRCTGSGTHCAAIPRCSPPQTGVFDGLVLPDTRRCRQGEPLRTNASGSVGTISWWTGSVSGVSTTSRG